MTDLASQYDPDRVARELDWNLLRTFVVLAESHSITDAANQLGLRQPSVSAALKKLEDRIGRKLLDRSPGRYALTDAGRLLYREAVEINGSVLRLSTLLRDLTDEVQGNIKIAVASHVVCPVLDDALARFHAKPSRCNFLTRSTFQRRCHCRGRGETGIFCGLPSEGSQPQTRISPLIS